MFNEEKVLMNSLENIEEFLTLKIKEIDTNNIIEKISLELNECNDRGSRIKHHYYSILIIKFINNINISNLDKLKLTRKIGNWEKPYLAEEELKYGICLNFEQYKHFIENDLNIKINDELIMYNNSDIHDSSIRYFYIDNK